MENGRKSNISIGEIIILGAALNVPPMTLVFPAVGNEMFEFLPGDAAYSIQILDWLSGVAYRPRLGRGGYVETPDEEKIGATPVMMLRRHRSLQQKIQTYYRYAWEDDTMQDAPGADEARGMARGFERTLFQLRDSMRRIGVELPPLSPSDQKKEEAFLGQSGEYAPGPSEVEGYESNPPF